MPFRNIGCGLQVAREEAGLELTWQRQSGGEDNNPDDVEEATPEDLIGEYVSHFLTQCRNFVLGHPRPL